MQKNKVESTQSELFRGLLVGGVSLFALLPTVAMAQDTVADPDEIEEAIAEEEEGDSIVVTGSRIKRREGIDSSINVQSVGSEELTLRGFTNAIDALEQLPVLGNGTNIDGANLANNDFTANPDVLNLGTNRTLTLVNGRRFTSSNRATVFVPGNANGVQVDLSLINPALIDRVEVVVGGSGSATYGTDAVAGVVNLILKDDFEGVELNGQYGITQLGDGQSYRVGGVVGKNFLDGRANITAGVEWLDSDFVDDSDPERPEGQALSGILRQDLNDPRLTTIISNTTNPLIPVNGLLVGAPFITGSTNNNFFPEQPNAAFPGGQSPFLFAQTPAGQAINSNLFLGTFANAGTFLTIPNTDTATSAFLPRLAVPLAFAPNGNLEPFNVGNILPPNLADQNTAIGGDGFPLSGFTTIRGDQQRISANLFTRFDIMENLTWKGEYFFADIANQSFGGPQSNAPTGSTTAGTRPIPVFIDENPFLNAQAVGVINGLVGQGLTVGDIGGSRALFLSRSLPELNGPDGRRDSNNDTTFFRTAQTLLGEFEAFGREFNWDVAGAYGRVETDAFQDEILDIEFALATDVVQGANGPVCRQQTLAAPEAIGVRNPQLGFINSGFPAPVTPTQAQIDACQPLNLFGAGAPSQAAIDYVTSPTGSNNVSSQVLAAGQFGGETFKLPAGFVLFSSQLEYRREANTFIPNDVFATGTGRNTLGQSSDGFLRFLEGGTEVSIPVFGGDFAPFAFKSLEINGAFRFVNRVGAGGPFNSESRNTAVTYSAGGTWTPIDELSFRGNRSRSTRSPSVVESFGAGVTGFSGAGRGNGNPCDVDSIDGDVTGVRRRNCETAVQLAGLPLSFLDGFQAPGGAAPAAGASNPNLVNETSDTWSIGVTIRPGGFLEGLVIQSDYYSVDLVDPIGLTFLGGNCFDLDTFPNSIVDGINTCNSLVFNIEDPNNPGSFIVPTNNILTGAPVLPIANPGSPSQDQEPFTSTFAFFDTANGSAVTELRGLTLQARYDFELGDLIGKRADSWGQISLVGTGFYLRRFDTFASFGQQANPAAGEAGNPAFNTRLDLIHRVGGLTHSLQWFRSSETCNNVTQCDTAPTQIQTFVQPTFDLFNYNASYNINENFTVGLVVNNLFNDQLSEFESIDPGTGQGDLLGRRFIFRGTARF